MKNGVKEIRRINQWNMAHPRGLQIHCLWKLSVDFYKESTYDIQNTKSAIALSPALVKPCLWLYSICSVSPTFLLLSFFSYIYLFASVFPSKKPGQFKDWHQCSHLSSYTPQAPHCSGGTPRTPLPSLPLHGTSKLFQAIPLEYCTLDALNFKQRGLTRIDVSTYLVAHLVCFFICTEE